MSARATELLLDTHTWIWLVRNDPELGPETRKLADQASSGGHLLLPAISVWELAMLATGGRIRLTMTTRTWVEVALAVPGLSVAELTPAIMVEAYDMPSPFHGDPADRMIVATARLRGATLLTRDRRILDYGARGHVSVLAA